MASSSDIRAGGAFVEVYVKNNMFTRGLQAAQNKLKSFQSFGDNVVGKLAGLAGVIATPVGLAVKEFTDLGRSLVEGSARTGATVEQLDALRFAAEQSGVGAEQLEMAIVKLNRTSATAPDKLERLGVSAKVFTNLSLEEKFEAVGEGIKDLKDDAQRTAAVMDIFGKSGAALLPMFKEGAGGIKAAMEEAKRLGLVMSGEDAQKAAELGKAFSKLQAVIKRTFMQLGAALLPIFEKIRTGIEDKIGKLQALQTIIRQNQGLITSGLQVAKMILKVAAAWVVLRTAITHTSTVLSLVQTLIGVVASVLGFILSPIGLVVAAIAGLSLLILMFPSPDLFSKIGDAIGGIGERATETWAAMKDALQMGDLAGAAKMAWLAVQVELFRIWKPIRLAWTDLMDFFGDGWDSMIALLEGSFNEFADYFTDIGESIGSALVKAVLEAIRIIQDNTKGLRAWLDRQGIKTFGDMNIDEQLKIAAAGDRGDDRKKQKERADRDKALSDDLDAKREARKTARDETAADLDKQIAEIEGKLANLKEEAWLAKFRQDLERNLPNFGEGGAVGIAGNVVADSTKGSFSGSADARSLAIGNDMAKKQDKTNDLLEDIKGELEDGGYTP